MAFRYINPGYGALTGDSSVRTLESSTYNPIHGVSFNKYSSSNNTILKVPVSESFSKEIYGKFNLYYDTGSWTTARIFQLGAESSRSTNYCVGVSLQSQKLYLINGWTEVGEGIECNFRALNKIWFHVKLNSSSECEATLIVNDTEITTNTSSGAVISEGNYFKINFPSQGNFGDKIYLSEMIISNEYISPKEKIVIPSIKTTETNMTAGENELYIADTAGQTILQTLDLDTLIENYGANSQITGIQIAGNPAYKTAIGLTSLTALSKANSIITEHDTFLLSDNTSAAVSTGWAVENTTIADLQNMQFGWRAGE